MSDPKENKTFEEDGIRPIESGDPKIADTFEEDGTRPIAKSPDFLVNNPESQTIDVAQNNDNLDNTKSDLAIDDDSPTDRKKVEVVDTFDEDGERPIMANEYEVIDTLKIDGNRPITKEK